MPGPVELITRPLVVGALHFSALSRSNIVAGFVDVASGIATATVSTTTVDSNSLILLTSHSDTASNATQALRVSSRAQGAYFGIQVAPAPVGTDYKVCFLIINQQ